jgi:uncharacterized membrane protein
MGAGWRGRQSIVIGAILDVIGLGVIVIVMEGVVVMYLLYISTAALRPSYPLQH